jgi:hypothetical protein
MIETIQKGEPINTLRRSYFTLRDKDNVALTGSTGKVNLSKLGGTPFASTNNIVEISNTLMPGAYYVEFTSAELDTLGEMLVRYKASNTGSAVEMETQIAVVDYNGYQSGSTLDDYAQITWAYPSRGLTDQVDVDTRLLLRQYGLIQIVLLLYIWILVRS